MFEQASGIPDPNEHSPRAPLAHKNKAKTIGSQLLGYVFV